VSAAKERYAAERRRQIMDEGRNPLADVGRADQLLRAAACYETAAQAIAHQPATAISEPPFDWPWHASFWKPDSSSRMREKAAGLAIAAIDAMAAWDDGLDRAVGLVRPPRLDSTPERGSDQ
jgi:hypothetical protein